MFLVLCSHVGNTSPDWQVTHMSCFSPAWGWDLTARYCILACHCQSRLGCPCHIWSPAPGGGWETSGMWQLIISIIYRGPANMVRIWKYYIDMILT